MKLDLGDVVLDLNLRVKAFRPPTFVWHFRAPVESEEEDRAVGPIPECKSQRKVMGIMDLQADKKVSFALQATDEVGNPTTFVGTIVFTVDDPTIVNLTDNGDGSGEVAATGTIGVATLTGTATRDSDGAVFTGAEAINVVAGDAEAFSLTFGTPEEVTPDV